MVYIIFVLYYIILYYIILYYIILNVLYYIILYFFVKHFVRNIWEKKQIQILQQCVSQNFGRKWENMTAGYTKFHVRSNYLNNLYSSPNSTEFIRSSRIKWRGLVTSTGDMWHAWYTVVGKFLRIDNVGDVSMLGRTEKRKIVRTQLWCGQKFSDSGQRRVVGSFEQSTKYLGALKILNF